MTQVAARRWGCSPNRFASGWADRLPPTPSHGGLDHGVRRLGDQEACIAVQEEAADAPSPTGARLFRGTARRPLARGYGVTVHREANAMDIAARAGEPIEAEASAQRDPEVAARYDARLRRRSPRSVDPDVGTINVRRAVGAYGAAASSTLAWLPATYGRHGRGHRNGADGAHRARCRDGRAVNAHMADYLVPVNSTSGRSRRLRRRE